MEDGAEVFQGVHQDEVVAVVGGHYIVVGLQLSVDLRVEILAGIRGRIDELENLNVRENDWLDVVEKLLTMAPGLEISV